MSEHNWNAIMRGAIPASIGVILVFANMRSSWIWAITVLCMIVGYGLVYTQSKKKADLFTCLALVFAVALVMHSLVRAGII